MWEKRHLPGSVVGVTPYLAGEDGIEYDRGEEISQWLQRNNAAKTPYVIIDDRSEEYAEKGRLVQVGYRRGLTLLAAKRACSVLEH